MSEHDDDSPAKYEHITEVGFRGTRVLDGYGIRFEVVAAPDGLTLKSPGKRGRGQGGRRIQYTLTWAEIAKMAVTSGSASTELITEARYRSKLMPDSKIRELDGVVGDFVPFIAQGEDETPADAALNAEMARQLSLPGISDASSRYANDPMTHDTWEAVFGSQRDILKGFTSKAVEGDITLRNGPSGSEFRVMWSRTPQGVCIGTAHHTGSDGVKHSSSETSPDPATAAATAAANVAVEVKGELAGLLRRPKEAVYWGTATPTPAAPAPKAAAPEIDIDLGDLGDL